MIDLLNERFIIQIYGTPDEVKTKSAEIQRMAFEAGFVWIDLMIEKNIDRHREEIDKLTDDKSNLEEPRFTEFPELGFNIVTNFSITCSSEFTDFDYPESLPECLKNVVVYSDQEFMSGLIS